MDDRAGWTPLHYACDGRRLKLVVWLAMAGADPNAKDAQGRGACPRDPHPPDTQTDTDNRTSANTKQCAHCQPVNPIDMRVAPTVPELITTDDSVGCVARCIAQLRPAWPQYPKIPAVEGLQAGLRSKVWGRRSGPECSWDGSDSCKCRRRHRRMGSARRPPRPATMAAVRCSRRCSVRANEIWKSRRRRRTRLRWMRRESARAH